MVRSNRMSSVASARMLRLLVSKVFLAEFNISPRNTDVVTTKRLPTSPTTMVVSSCRCWEGSRVLLKCPRRAAPSTDRKVSTAATSAFRFFSFHVIRAMTRLAGVRRQADPGDRDPPDRPAASRLEPAKIYSQRQRQTKTMGAAMVRAAWRRQNGMAGPGDRATAFENCGGGGARRADRWPAAAAAAA